MSALPLDIVFHISAPRDGASYSDYEKLNAEFLTGEGWGVGLVLLLLDDLFSSFGNREGKVKVEARMFYWGCIVW